ncbi:hypothetical protein BKA67DRAFT_496362, partial [Truncatella angustata]
MSDPDIYTVGWICAITTEFVAARAFLDEEHKGPKHVAHHDNNNYILGRIGEHNVVIAVLPDGDYGTASAAGVARDMLHSFPNIRIGLMVGIGGGAPSAKHDIRLGDIVVSAPRGSHGGVFQYDFGKTIQYQEFQATRFLDQPPAILRAAVSGLKAQFEADGHQIQEAIQAAFVKKPRLRQKYDQLDPSTDRLYRADIVHPPEAEVEAACLISCGSDTSLLVARPARDQDEDNPMIHYGLIASANQLMKDAVIRDKLAQEEDVLCFEMEAAGLMNHFPCLVIRGICDYSDTHKNNLWQGYAAMAAAAYTKNILNRIAPNRVEVVRKLSELLNEMDSTLTNMHTDIKSIRMDKYSDDLMQWLAPPHVSFNMNKAIEARYPGSGRRLLESEAYTTWKKGDNSFLWLHGIPGCGKTILASTVIEDLQKNQSQSALQTLLYFYFDFTDSRKQLFENTLRSLVWQIYCRNENSRQHLNSLYSSTCRGGKEQPSFDSLQRTFTEMMGNLEEVWIVLDALDECETRNKLLSWIRNIAQDSSAQVNIRLLVTSRPEQDIMTAIQRHASDEQIIAISHNLLESDIRNYVQARVREHEGLSRWRGYKEIQDQIEASLLEKANGMFRWVSCQLDALEDCLERKSLFRALQSLPKTLDETYERILASIPSAHVQHTRRILQFLTYSERPLRLDEAVDAIAVDVGKNVARGRRFDFKDRLPVPEEITRYCSSLVALVSRQGKYREEQTVKEIQLAHFSVKDYLASDRLESKIGPYLQETSARSAITEVCLAYLLELEQSKSAREIKNTFYFAHYAARYWASHAIISERNSQYAFKLMKELFLNRPRIESWCLLYDPDRSWA